MTEWHRFTRRTGVIHELSGRDDGRMLCGLVLTEPETLTDAPVNCVLCLKKMERDQRRQRET